MATKAKKGAPASAGRASELRPLEALLADEPPRSGETRMTYRMPAGEYELFRKLAQKFAHSPQSVIEMAINEFLVRRGIRPFKGLSGKLNRDKDPLRDWDESAAKSSRP